VSYEVQGLSHYSPSLPNSGSPSWNPGNRGASKPLTTASTLTGSSLPTFPRGVYVTVTVKRVPATSSSPCLRLVLLVLVISALSS
jgi:hypothetical protein